MEIQLTQVHVVTSESGTLIIITQISGLPCRQTNAWINLIWNAFPVTIQNYQNLDISELLPSADKIMEIILSLVISSLMDGLHHTGFIHNFFW